MKTYSVLINQPMERLGRVEVEAESEEDAMALAEQIIEEGDYEEDVEWGESSFLDSAEVLSAEENEE